MSTHPDLSEPVSHKLVRQWRRLYASDLGANTSAPHMTEAASALTDAQGRVRAMVLTVSKPADWGAVGRVWSGVQTELGWPAPAIAVDGLDGLQLWFSLTDPCPAAEAGEWLQALCARFLADLEPRRLRCWPAAAEADASSSTPRPVPQTQVGSDQWSAFVSPDLAPVFEDSPWLDVAPGEDAQASLLMALQSVRTEDARQALGRPAGAPTAAPAVPAAPRHTDPRRFLLEVMNDERADLACRIEAARILLAHASTP
jgi:hypothetical protein